MPIRTPTRSRSFVFGIAPSVASTLAAVLALASVRTSAEERTAEHQHGHAQYHAEFYSSWRTVDGASCCNNQDCAPIADDRIRMQGNAVQVRIGDDWVPVPQENIRPYQAPDLSSHLCHVGQRVLCLVFGGGI